MGANPEPKIELTAQKDGVTWIGREHAPLDPVTPLKPIVPPASEGGGSSLKTKLISIGVAALVLAVIAAILWYGKTPSGPPQGLAGQQSTPLVSVMSPGVSPV